MKTSYKNFTYQLTENGTAIFKANRPQVKNAMNTPCWEEFLSFLQEAQRDERVRVIVLSGEGDAFIAGADISEVQNAPASAALFSASGEVVRLLETGRKPVIAAVNGAAFGGGFEVAIACDIRIASESAVFGLPETGLGLIPGMGGTQRLCKLIGLGRAKEVVMAGRNIRAEDAAAWGLAMKCVPAEALMDEALKIAARMMEKGPNALAVVKRCMNLAYSTDDATGLLIENLGFCTLMGDTEAAEGVNAFLQKRKPSFYEESRGATE